MLSQDSVTDERQGDERGQKADRGLLRRGLPLVVAFATGFLFGRRRSDKSSGDDAGDDAGSGVGRIVGNLLGQRSGAGTEQSSSTGTEQSGSTGTKQPSSMGSVAGEQARERERESETESAERETTESAERESSEQAAQAESETSGVDSELAALSAPTTRGMPMFGLGTYQMDEYDECFESVRMALKMGYRHFDTAEGYDNETAVGDAIAEADVAREDLFVATKISPDNLDYDHVLTNAEESLERLGVEYVDLLYVHWPTGEYEAMDTLEAFAELREEGLIKEIGVSNFTVDLLEEAIDVSEEPIFANQVEMHPLLQQTELQQFCAQDDVDVDLVAYSPIARGEVEDIDELQDIAEKHDASPVQVSLAWLREKDVTAIPKATSWHHLRENWLSLDLELDDEDVEKIDAIDEQERLVDPDRAPWNQ